MRNLSVYFQKYYEESAPDVHASALCSVPFSNTDFILSKSGCLFTIGTDSDDVLNELDCASIVETETGIMGQTYQFCTYLSESEVLFCGTKEGVIFLVDINTDDVTISGDIEGGIACIEWSPDQEYCAVLGYNGSILLMNSMCEVLYESTIENMSSLEDILISWRGDNEFFGISFVENQLKKRVIYIFDKELQLHAKVRDMQDQLLPGLLPVLSWSTDGSLLATIQLLRNEYFICLIEVNGYKHLDYHLQVPSGFAPLALSWSCQSTYISLLYFYTMGEELSYGLQLFARDNYQLFTKHTSTYAVKPLCVYFDSIVDTQFKVLFENTSYIHYFCTVSSNITNDYSSTNLVIDGEKLHLTPLQLCVPSPPVTSVTLSFPSCLNAASSLYSSFNQYLPESIVALSSSSIYFLSTKEQFCMNEDAYEHHSIPLYQLNKKILDQMKQLEITETVDVPIEYQSKLHSPLYFSSSLVYFLAQNIIPNSYSLVEYDVSQKEWNSYSFQIPIIHVSYRDEQQLLIEDINGQLYLFDTLTKTTTNYKQLLCPCPTLYNIYDPDHSLDCIIALDTNYKFYIDNQLISSSVTFLCPLPLYKTVVYIKSLSPPRLCFIPYNQLLSPKLNAEGVPSDSLLSRAIERGSCFIAFGNYDGRVILQMPRGNYECIYPRYISIQIFIKLYEQHRFNEMIEKMRREKLPFDLIYDYNPGAFFDFCPSMIENIEVLNRISLIVSNIVNVDLMSEGHEYSSVPKPEGYIAAKEGDKKDLICDAIFNSITAIEEKNPTVYQEGTYLDHKVSCLVNKVKPDIKGCLLLIKQFVNVNRPKAEKALEWLIILSDVQFIYNTCLSIYDIPMCLLIATKSQMDPRDYKPFLNRLYSLTPLEQHYEIDKYLNQPSAICKDIHDLITLSDPPLSSEQQQKYIEEMIDVCKKNALFTECLELYKDHECKNDLLKAYASHLETSGDYSQAMNIYLSLSSYMQAYDCAIKLGEGVQAISFLYMEGLSEKEIKGRLQELCVTLSTGKEKEIEQAAYIYCHYLNDLDDGVNLYISIKQYITAYNVCILKHREDLIETELYTKCKSNVPLLKQEFSTKLQKMTQCHKRLNEIHRDRQLIQVDKDEDNMSLWSNMTGATGITAISGMTSFINLQSANLDPSLPDVQLNINKLRDVSPVNNLDALTHRATSSDSRSQKSSRIMSFGNQYSENIKDTSAQDASNNGRNKKKTKIRRGSKEEEKSLRLMVDIIMNRDRKNYEEEIHQTNTILIYMKKISLAKELLEAYEEFNKEVSKLYSDIPAPTTEDVEVPNTSGEQKTEYWKQNWLNYM